MTHYYYQIQVPDMSATGAQRQLERGTIYFHFPPREKAGWQIIAQRVYDLAEYAAFSK